MKYSIYINQVKAIDWKLNLTEASVFAFCYELPSWANSSNINGELWYQYAKGKIIKEYPLLTTKPDTIYRVLKKLERLELIKLTKIMGIDHLTLTDKAKCWNDYDPSVGKKSDSSNDNPKRLGKKSESDSEKNPTYNNTNTDNITKDDNLTLFPEQKKTKGTSDAKMCLFANSKYFNIDTFKEQFNNPDYLGVDINYYYHTVADWSSSKGAKKKDWIATARNFMRNDKRDNKLQMLASVGNEKNAIDNKAMLDYLNNYE